MADTGRVKFFNEQKGFGFIANDGGDVFVHANRAGDFTPLLVAGALVTYEYAQEYRNDGWKKAVTRVISVEAPLPEPEPVLCWALVLWYDEKKGMGMVVLAEPYAGKKAVVFESACRDAGVIPGKDMPMKAKVTKTSKGLRVASFEAGPHITAESMRSESAMGDASVPAKVSKRKKAKVAVTDTAMAAAFKAASDKVSVSVH